MSNIKFEAIIKFGWINMATMNAKKNTLIDITPNFPIKRNEIKINNNT